MADAYKIMGAEALWPKLDKTYHFDKKLNQSVPCDPMAPNAEYSIELKMDSATAKNLYIAMVTAYKEDKQKGWPDAPSNPMTKHDDGTRTVKCTLKGQYNGSVTRKPLQVDSRNNPMTDDFQLTTGSIVNVGVTFYPYKYMSNEPSVSLRLRQLQVVQLADRTIRSMFDVVDGGYVHNEESMFSSNIVDMPQKEEVSEPEPEPIKTTNKKAASGGSNNSSLDDILGDWDD